MVIAAGRLLVDDIIIISFFVAFSSLKRYTADEKVLIVSFVYRAFIAKRRENTRIQRARGLVSVFSLFPVLLAIVQEQLIQHPYTECFILMRL